ncbi:MAG: recombinase A, recombination protein RecA [candidate division WS6 bacterium GW2011_GWC1_33_20]|uniref:Protein RecA n=2 Tax=Candidatus Dojkabacteria TaxID=74243 RepID=A0A0G0AT00_9BACT|nr:MAG: recombinase A, recombination protein RecA [candidate division WS6 bacterium GW2011_GWE2_33_157]KKP44094.1 MAG: recombinase A, recombination protein RecA [candidate division WS6 bacterium GW2011_GWC1_33_20]KKP45033.1 MAG: recombinase A, recombination protein RecA [candidate division WS6 bacterium GW2011_GWF1_33_233]KKP54504.1 MAG: recombinase A, recombination protein RecA [candidate division WS6 bacterium GW2011_WS6_33_547]KKP54571.1 MAG: Protein RecA [candidate division WS6 bacterium GW
MVANNKEVKEMKETIQSSKGKAIDVAVAQIEKQFGKGSIMRLGSKERVEVEVIPTGALSLDMALGIGGIPKGRIIEIYGPESSGKTTLSIHILAEAQKKGDAVAFIDAEHAFDPVYAKNIGLDIDNLYISQPDFGEQALEILETLVRSSAFGVIVVDSVAALTPRAEIEGEMGDSHMGLQARLMSQALRKLTAITGKTGTTIIFLNQLRMKIGVMFGNPETTTGGNALKFYASIRMDIRQRDKIMRDGNIVGHTRVVKVVKNKMAPPFKEASFDMIYPVGIDKESSILDAAIQLSIVEKSGAWFRYGDQQLAQGRDSTVLLLKEDKKLRDEIEKAVRAKMK